MLTRSDLYQMAWLLANVIKSPSMDWGNNYDIKISIVPKHLSLSLCSLFLFLSTEKSPQITGNMWVVWKHVSLHEPTLALWPRITGFGVTECDIFLVNKTWWSYVCSRNSFNWLLQCESFSDGGSKGWHHIPSVCKFITFFWYKI